MYPNIKSNWFLWIIKKNPSVISAVKCPKLWKSICVDVIFECPNNFGTPEPFQTYVEDFVTWGIWIWI